MGLVLSKSVLRKKFFWRFFCVFRCAMPVLSRLRLARWRAWRRLIFPDDFFLDGSSVSCPAAARIKCSSSDRANRIVNLFIQLYSPLWLLA